MVLLLLTLESASSAAFLVSALRRGLSPAPAPSPAAASRAAYSGCPCVKGTVGANFISMQKVYSWWAPPELIPQANSFLSAVEYFILPISESTYVKKDRREIQSAQLRSVKQIMQPP